MADTPAALTADELRVALADLPDWRPRPDRLHAVYRCPTSAAAIDLIAAIGGAAERLGHHPDLRWSYDLVIVRTTTHDAGDRVTALDVELATRVSELAAAAGAEPRPPKRRPQPQPLAATDAFPVGRSTVAGSDDERELYLDWLRFLRAAVLRKATGLDDQQARSRPDGKLIALAGIVNHLTHVEWRWIEGGMLGQPVGRDEDEFTPGPELTPADLVTAYRERAARTDEVVRSLPLSAPCSTEPGADLRWVLVHLINETARHAGHADATRELIDGLTGE